MPFRRTCDSLLRHVFQYLSRDNVEDHLAAIVCNAMFLMRFEADGRSDLDDRYQEPTKGIEVTKEKTPSGTEISYLRREKNPEKNLTPPSPDAKLKSAAEEQDAFLEILRGCEYAQESWHKNEDGSLRHGTR